ncbi:MAG: diheme cytochrome c precursor [Verrucomicrobia bacterium]|nr:diheme cytochrome c precursor [Verrucomicrobiota bacterium]
MSEREQRRERSRRLARVLAAFVLTAAVSGFFMGLQGNRSQLSLTRPVGTFSADSLIRTAEAPPGVATAVRYEQVDRRKYGPNAGWTSDLRQLQETPAAALSAPASEEERRAALAERTRRRAFDGAPPTIPHPILQDTSAACLACHGPGLRIKDRIASKISHPPYANCTQCHAPTAGPWPTQDARLLPPPVGNDFVGATPTAGTRATPGAPPTVPHGIALRSDCLSCHGPAGLYGLRTSHPERQSCLQCHAPGAAHELRAARTPGVGAAQP